MPFVLWTTLRRLGKVMNSGSEAGYMAAAFNGMVFVVLLLLRVVLLRREGAQRDDLID